VGAALVQAVDVFTHAGEPCDPGRMAEGSGGRVFAYVLLGLSALLSYQAWQTSKTTPEIQQLAKDHACDLDSTCMVKTDRPRLGKTDVLRHRYEFETTQGIFTVTCKRELVLFGDWQCTPTAGRIDPEPL
jgi:hypothetical protein